MTRLKPSLDQLARDALEDLALPIIESDSAAGQSEDQAIGDEEPTPT
jgi:hypothetical protein